MEDAAAQHPYADLREMISRVTALCLEAAEDCAGEIRQTVDPEVRSRSVADLDRMARSIRAGALAIARLDREARVETHDRKRDDGEARRDAENAANAIRDTRLRAQIARLPWPEDERLDALDAFEEIDPDGLSFEDIVRRICREADLDMPELPDPPPPGEVAPQASEGASAPKPATEPTAAPLSQPSERKPPQSLRNSSPEGGALVYLRPNGLSPDSS